MGITRNTDTAQQKLDSDNIQHEKNIPFIYSDCIRAERIGSEEKREAFRNATHRFGSQDERGFVEVQRSWRSHSYCL